MTATVSARKGRPARPHPPIPLPLEVMGMLFTENAANSSLQADLGLPGGTRWNLPG